MSAFSHAHRRSATKFMNSPQHEAPLHIAFYCNLLGWPKRSGGGVRQWVLTMANALVEAGHQVDILTEAPARRFIDEPLLDARIRREIGRASCRERVCQYV